MIRRFFALLMLLLASACLTAADKPNVIVFYTDDQGSVDVNCYGSKDLVTPHMDRLAAEGVRFTQMLAPSAICSASRAGLITGRFPIRAGVPANVSSDRGTPGMPHDEVTLADMLKAAGYATAHIGKWHLGYTPETMPNGQGFDYSFGHMGGCIDNYSHFFYWSGPNRHDLWRNGGEVFHDGRYFPDLIVEESRRFIDAQRDKPFFMYVAINMPHYPLQGTEKWREVYKDLPAPRRMYAEFLSTMDEKIGEIVKHLDARGLRQSTLIIVQSDHGHSLEERTFHGGGSAGPYRGAKGTLWEGGLRVPSIVSMPGRIPQGEVRDQFVTGCDWLPTIAEFCGVTPPSVHLDGRSIASVITDNAPSPHRQFYWQLGRGNAPQWAVREGDWKLLGNPKNPESKEGVDTTRDRLFLVNLREDIGEKTNVADRHPDVVARLKKLQADYAAQLESR